MVVLRQEFIKRFKHEPVLFRSPGRVNLIGEHTDYNKGFVLPASINLEMFFAIAPNASEKCRIFSYDLNESDEFSIKELKESEKRWNNYIIGVVAQFIKGHYKIGGFDCVFGGQIPIGAGLSSSAALECGIAYALNDLFRLNIDKLTLVKMAQKAEHEFAKVNCGIMDQFSSILGRENNAIMLDCQNLDNKYIPLNYTDDYALIIINSGVSHFHAISEYNKRIKECQTGVNFINKKEKRKFNSLRELDLDLIQRYKNTLDPIIYKRCQYVIEENERVLEASKALENGDIKKFGALMYQSHEGLKNLFDVSCKELDFLVDQTKTNSNVLGARMTGGGFGGCTINIVKKEFSDDFIKEISAEYKRKFSIKLKYYLTQIVNGTNKIF
ncbi:galactokinase [Flexithrix dorotheae]|uniref:galactokinase n=1 Tax=Flexithrix dorotheae TaxID=70993 RepID=UPI000365507F|nr:galactokinase [Flexithrix dorotheae]